LTINHQHIEWTTDSSGEACPKTREPLRERIANLVTCNQRSSSVCRCWHTKNLSWSLDIFH